MTLLVGWLTRKIVLKMTWMCPVER